MVRLLSHLLGSYVTHVLHTAWISNDERVLYNDTETLMVRLLSHLLGSYVTHVLHTAWISNDERVLYNDTETLVVRLPSHLLGLYMAHVLHTLKIKKICFSLKVSIQPCRPKSDSALPGAIGAQFRPKKAQSKGYCSLRKGPFQLWDQISPRRLFLLA